MTWIESKKGLGYRRRRAGGSHRSWLVLTGDLSASEPSNTWKLVIVFYFLPFLRGVVGLLEPKLPWTYFCFFSAGFKICAERG